MHETSNRTGRYGRRILWLGVAVVVLIAAYTAGWFWLARKIEREADLTLARLQERGMKADGGAAERAAATVLGVLVGLIAIRRQNAPTPTPKVFRSASASSAIAWRWSRPPRQ